MQREITNPIISYSIGSNFKSTDVHKSNKMTGQKEEGKKTRVALTLMHIQTSAGSYAVLHGV